MATTIKLSKGYFAVIDDEDAARVNAYRWCSGNHKSCGRDYIVPMRRKHGAKAGKKVKYETLPEFLIGKRRGLEISYRDGNSLNCTKSNLRHGTRSMIWGGRRKMNPHKYSSTFKGVSWAKSCSLWYTYAEAEGHRHHLGYFKYENDAARAYNDKALELFGEFARLNVVPAGHGRRKSK